MKKKDIEALRENPNRSVLMIVNEISKIFEESIMKNEEILFLKEKTARMILAHLSHHNGVTQNELVRATQMKGSTVSVSINRLEEQGYVKREPHPYDMRATLVYLTKKGIELSEKTKKIFDSRDQEIMHGISERDIRTTKYVLEKMLDNLVE